jgi:CTP synthase
VARTYGATDVNERHRHRYEVNNAYREQSGERRPAVQSGTSPDGTLVEFAELPRDVHPYYVSTQAHPEFLSRPDRAHPLFAGLVEAALVRQRAERLVEVEREPAPASA